MSNRPAIKARLNIFTSTGWVLEVDIRKFFDNLDHGHLRTFLRRRVRDGVLLRLIDKKDRNGPRDDRPGTFDLLGFTHYWGRSLKGYWVVKLKTAADRFSRAVRSIDLGRLSRHV